MTGKEDARLGPVRDFTLTSFGLDPERWREFVSTEETTVTFSTFLSAQGRRHLFLWRRPDGGLTGGFRLPGGGRCKAVCVSKPVWESSSAENTLMLQEVRGSNILSITAALTEEASRLIRRSSSSWVPGLADEALRLMRRQTNMAVVMEAQMEGHMFLPLPDTLGHHDHHDSVLHHSDSPHDDDGGFHGNSEELKRSHAKLLHTCEEMIMEWAELVSDFLQQDWSSVILHRQKPLPSEEFSFWKKRLKNLHFIQQQLMSTRAQQVASIVQSAGSIYWSTLKDIYRDIQEGLQEMEDVTVNLSPLQEKLEEVQHMEYQQLEDNMVVVMEAVHLLWIRSKFYCEPGKIVILLQEICNLLIHLSRKFLRGQEVMRALASDPGRALGDVRLVIRTLQTLKEAYTHNRTLLEDQQQSDTVAHRWDFPSHLVLFQLDSFLTRLHRIQEVFCVTLQLTQLNQTVLCSDSGRVLMDAVQRVYQDFLVHARLLSESSYDPTDLEDPNFEPLLDQFWVQILDLETELGSVLNWALGDCSGLASAAKLLKMFEFVLDRRLIWDQLQPHMSRLRKMVLMELDQTEQLFYSHTEKSRTFSRFSPTAAARLGWTQQLHLRAESALTSYQTIQHLCAKSAECQLVPQRFQHILELLQDFRDNVRSSWSCQLDSDCGFILKHVVIQHTQHGSLEVSCSRKVEAILRALRCVSRDREVELRPHAAQLFACREDLRQTYLSLCHMVSCYNQLVCDGLQPELTLIQNQLQNLSQSLSDLQRMTWSSEGVQQMVVQQMEAVSASHAAVREARTNMEAMRGIIQGWGELHLLQRSGESLLEGGVKEETCKRITEDGQHLLKLTRVNKSLYAANDESESWIRYLDHIDDLVQEGLLSLLLRALHFLSANTAPQSCSAPLVAVSLQLQETGSVFEPLVDGGLSNWLQTIISDVFSAASLLPRISLSRHGNYQVCLQQNPELCALEQEVMHHLLQVKEEAEHLKTRLDRYSNLWQNDRSAAFQEFLTYSRQLEPDELEADETPPTLKDFQREIESLHRLHSEVAHLDEVIILCSWLRVNLQPFRDSLLSIIHQWKHMYTQYLLESVSNSLQQVILQDSEDEASSSSRFPLTETVLLLEAAAVQLPEHLAAQLQC